MSQTISIERVDHIGIRVRDLDRRSISIGHWGSASCIERRTMTWRSSATRITTSSSYAAATDVIEGVTRYVP